MHNRTWIAPGLASRAGVSLSPGRSTPATGEISAVPQLWKIDQNCRIRPGLAGSPARWRVAPRWLDSVLLRHRRI